MPSRAGQKLVAAAILLAGVRSPTDRPRKRGNAPGPSRSTAEAGEFHQAGGLPIGFLNPFDNTGWVRRILKFDGDDAIDLQFFYRLEIGLELDDTAARGEVTVDFAVAIADVNMDGF